MRVARNPIRGPSSVSGGIALAPSSATEDFRPIPSDERHDHDH